jgi:hypothetical protein
LRTITWVRKLVVSWERSSLDLEVTHVSSLDVLDGQVLDVESDVVSGSSLGEGLVMHLDGLALKGDAHGSEDEDHTGLDTASLDSADGICADTGDLVDILEGSLRGLLMDLLGS